MKHKIDVMLNKKIIETLEFSDGTYIIGRSTDSDIHLDNSNVSRNHVKLEIYAQTLTIKDLNSRNSTFINEENIAHKKFNNRNQDIQIEIRPYTIVVNALKQNKTYWSKYKPFLESIIYSNINVSLCVLLALTVTFSFLLSSMIFNFQADKQHLYKNNLRGILLSRHLAEMNKYFLEYNRIDLLKTSPIDKEQGVKRAFIINTNGTILYPPNESEKKCMTQDIDTALSKKELFISSLELENLKVIYVPVLGLSDFHTIYGYAVVEYDLLSGKCNGWLANAILFTSYILILLLSLKISFFWISSFIKPMKELNSAINVALKDEKQRQTFFASNWAYDDLQDIAETFKRILRKEASEEGSTENQFDTIIENSSALPSDVPSAIINIDVQIVNFNSGFIDFINNSSTSELSIKKSMHLIEIRNDETEGLINGICECIEQKNGIEKIITVEFKKAHIVIKKTSTENPSEYMFTFIQGH